MRNNLTMSRFEIDVEGKTVIADYSRSGNALNILHVETPPELRGQGAAGKLMQEIAGYAEKENLKLVPVCSYAVAWMKRHKL